MNSKVADVLAGWLAGLAGLRLQDQAQAGSHSCLAATFTLRATWRPGVMLPDGVCCQCGRGRSAVLLT